MRTPLIGCQSGNIDSPFRYLYQHDLSCEELQSDGSNRLSDFDLRRHSESLISSVALEISHQAITRDFQAPGEDEPARKICIDNEDPLLQTDLHRLHLIQTIQSLIYINELPSNTKEMAEAKLNKVELPPPLRPSQTKTLLFDLDETLAHCVAGEALGKQHQIWLTTESLSKQGTVLMEDLPVAINLRPHVQDCLRQCAERY